MALDYGDFASFVSRTLSEIICYFSSGLRQVPGRIDAATGEIEFADLADPEVDDLLDDLSEWVLKMGGQVVIVPKERMPTLTGVAAIYRF